MIDENAGEVSENGILLQTSRVPVAFAYSITILGPSHAPAHNRGLSQRGQNPRAGEAFMLMYF